jgi:phage terminase Nu1 subunit (DNA packaging protein)
MRVTGQENIASLFGVVPKTITEWQEVGFPVAVQGGPGVPSQYDSAACIRWLVDRELGKIRAESPKDRVLRLQAENLELDLAARRGTLIEAATVEPAMKAAIVSARERIRNEPARIALALDGLGRSEREELLRNLFDEVLTKLSAWRQEAVEAIEGESA